MPSFWERISNRYKPESSRSDRAATALNRFHGAVKRDVAQEIAMGANYDPAPMREAKKEFATYLVSLGDTSEDDAMRAVELIAQFTRKQYTEKRTSKLDESLQAIFGARTDNAIDFFNALGNYTRINGTPTEVTQKRENLIISFTGNDAETNAKQLRAQLNALKEEFCIDGLFASFRVAAGARKGELESVITIERAIVEQLITAQKKSPENFTAVIEKSTISSPSATR